jgi:hypothetical protein
MKFFWTIITLCIIFHQLQLCQSEITFNKLFFSESKPINLRRFNVFASPAHRNSHIEEKKMPSEKQQVNLKYLQMEREKEYERKKLNGLIEKNSKLAFLRDFYGPRYF